MSIGTLVMVLAFHEYTGCIGTLKAVEDKLALLTMVYCPYGVRYDYVAGIPLKKLEGVNADISSDRSRKRSEQ